MWMRHMEGKGGCTQASRCQSLRSLICAISVVAMMACSSVSSLRRGGADVLVAAVVVADGGVAMGVGASAAGSEHQIPRPAV